MFITIQLQYILKYIDSDNLSKAVIKKTIPATIYKDKFKNTGDMLEFTYDSTEKKNMKIYGGFVSLTSENDVDLLSRKHIKIENNITIIKCKHVENVKYIKMCENYNLAQYFLRDGLNTETLKNGYTKYTIIYELAKGTFIKENIF